MGTVHRGYVCLCFQLLCQLEWGGHLFCGDADKKGHLCESQRGTSRPKKVKIIKNIFTLLLSLDLNALYLYHQWLHAKTKRPPFLCSYERTINLLKIQNWSYRRTIKYLSCYWFLWVIFTSSGWVEIKVLRHLCGVQCSTISKVLVVHPSRQCTIWIMQFPVKTLVWV